MIKNKILVTGGGGLVGSAIESISSTYPDYNFIFTNHNEYDLTQESAVKELFENVKPYYVIHTAAFVGGIGRNLANPAQQYYQNILMNSYVTHYAYLNGVKRLIAFSSICAFPEFVNIMSEEKLHDGAPHRSYFSYAYAKRLVDVQNQAYNAEYGTEYCTLIPGNIYGKRDNFNLEYGHVIPSLIHKCYLAKLDGKLFNIWGDGSVYREFIYSEDIAKIAIELIINNSKIPTSIIASGNDEIQIKEVVNLICNAFDYHQINWEKEKPMGQLNRPTSKELLNTILPNFIFKSLDDGIKETVSWFNQNYPNIRK